MSNIGKVVLVLGALVLTACGGGSGNSVAGIDRTGSPVTVSYGPVSAFGSVVVNGVRFDTSSAQVVVEGQPGTLDDLSVGDVVIVTGTVNANGTTGVATSVTFDDNVQGPIASIDSIANKLVVLGQTVRSGEDTSFGEGIEPPSVAGLIVGDIVEVSGLVESDGSIRATRIERKSAGSGFEITGVVANHDGVAHTFNINAQVVDYSAAQLQGFPGGSIVDGQLVEVHGGTLAGLVLGATSVEFRNNALGGPSGARREVEGFITRFASAADFDVAGLPVTTTAQTVIQGGVLALNAKVEVEGTLNAAGVLVASKVEVRAASSVRVRSFVDSVNAAGGSIVVFGVTATVNALTRFEDQSAQELRPFSLSDIAVGDYVEIRGTLSSGGALVATLVERTNPRGTSGLRGLVQSVSRPLFTLLGVQVATSARTEFENRDGSDLNATQFFSTVGVGSLVEVEGVEVGDQALDADEVELKN